MNPFKRLAAQTAVYGISSILGRFINYLLVPLFTYYFTPREYGVVSEFYAYAGFFAVLLAFGFETGRIATFDNVSTSGGLQIADITSNDVMLSVRMALGSQPAPMPVAFK